MADLVVAHFNEHIAAASLDPDADAGYERANELAPYAPCGVYPTLDGWIALAVEGDDQRARLVEVVGDGPLDDATRTHGAEELAAALRAVGISAERALGADDLVADAQLAARGFFTTVEHDDWGRRSLVGLPWRVDGGPPIALDPPPRFAPMEGTAT